MRCKKKISTGRESSHLQELFIFFVAKKWKKHLHYSKLVTCPSSISSFTPRQRDEFQHCAGWAAIENGWMAPFILILFHRRPFPFLSFSKQFVSENLNSISWNCSSHCSDLGSSESTPIKQIVPRLCHDDWAPTNHRDVTLMSTLRYTATQRLSYVCFQLIAHSCPVGICTCSFIGSANQDKSPTPGAAIDSPRASRCLSEKPWSLLWARGSSLSWQSQMFLFFF